MNDPDRTWQLYHTQQQDPGRQPPSASPLLPPEGYLDRASLTQVDGWAFDHAAGDQTISLRILHNDVVVGTTLADRYREDLVAAGKGTGCHSFLFTFPQPLPPGLHHVIRVQRLDGQDLANSPLIVSPAPALAPQPDAPQPTPAEPIPAEPILAEPPAAEPPAPDAAVSRPGAWRGYVDVVSRNQIAGWAWNPAEPASRASLQVIDNGHVVARIAADRHRMDLEQAGMGDGSHAFQVDIPGGLSPLEPHVIQVRLDHDGTELPNSPQTIEAARPTDPGFQLLVAGALADSASDADDARALAFLLDAAETLRQRRALANPAAGTAAFPRRCNGAAHMPRSTPRLLAIADHLPAPGRDDALLAHAAAFQRIGYAVAFVAAEDPGATSDAVAAAGIETPRGSSAEDVLRTHAGCFDIVYLHRAPVAARYLAIARQHNPAARIVYAHAAPGQPMSPIEHAAAAEADLVLTSAEDDVAALLWPAASHGLPNAFADMKWPERTIPL